MSVGASKRFFFCEIVNSCRYGFETAEPPKKIARFDGPNKENTGEVPLFEGHCAGAELLAAKLVLGEKSLISAEGRNPSLPYPRGT